MARESKVPEVTLPEDVSVHAARIRIRAANRRRAKDLGGPTLIIGSTGGTVKVFLPRLIEFIRSCPSLRYLLDEPPAPRGLQVHEYDWWPDGEDYLRCEIAPGLAWIVLRTPTPFGEMTGWTARLYENGRPRILNGPRCSSREEAVGWVERLSSSVLGMPA